jgi:N-acetylglucosaminyl-diphospho-decaprenol L-rhamnosyltransferase
VTVAVAVVSWNTRDLLDRCLRSLDAAAQAGAAEVWVVDNGSSDGSQELVRESHAWARLIEPGENLGFGRAVNLVARETRSEWIAASNADVELTANALDRMLAAAAEHPRAGAIAPRLVLPDSSTQHSVYAFPSIRLALITALRLGRVSRRIARRHALLGHQPHAPAGVDWAVAAFLLVRREAFEAVGGFDETQWLFAEDLDLGWRLARAGWSTRYEPDAVVHHHESAATAAAFGAERTHRTMEATYAWLVRRRGRAPASAIAAIGVGAAALELLAAAVLLDPRRRERARFWLRIHGRGLRSCARGGPRAAPSSPRAPRA